jgi:hypothetical protein
MKRRVVLALFGMGCAGSAWAGSVAAQRAPGCSAGSVSGAYGFSLTGTNVHAGSYAIVGRLVADGKVRFQGSASQSVSGHVYRNTISGTYTVATDCTGTVSLELAGGAKANLSFVIVTGGEELLLIATDAGTIETGVAKRIAAPRLARP